MGKGREALATAQYRSGPEPNARPGAALRRIDRVSQRRIVWTARCNRRSLPYRRRFNVGIVG